MHAFDVVKYKMLKKRIKCVKTQSSVFLVCVHKLVAVVHPLDTQNRYFACHVYDQE